MLLSMPGPSSSANGASVDTTGSPTYRPDVSSETWTNAVSPSSRMISPINFSLPTRTMSYIRAPANPRAITAGPEIRVMTPLVPAMPHPLPSLRLASHQLSELHGESDVLLHQAGDVGLAALEMGAGRRQRHDDREVAPPQEPDPGLIRAFQQILVDHQQPVSGRGVITDQPQRLLGPRRLADFHA